jgi:hypothetical protein
MRFRSPRHALPRLIVRGALLLALVAPAALAEEVSSKPPPVAAPGCAPPPGCAMPSAGAPGAPGGATSPFDFTGAADTASGTLTAGMGGAAGGSTFALDDVGYIDDAIPRTMFRLRFDAQYDNNRPDRAEFFYGKCGCFRQSGDPKAPGPPQVETSIDTQDLSAYLEVAVGNRASGFVEVPWRFLNPEQNLNANGIGDMNFGGKFAIIAQQDTYFTFQFRTYLPTGDALKGLGNDHVSFEPALLLYQRLGERLAVQAELRDWIPVDGTDFAGNVLRYGFGASYLAFNRTNFRVMPSAEVVGWSVLSGKELALASVGVPAVTHDAEGDTIINAKVGVRFGFGALEERGLLSASDLYIGYGRCLTGEFWYKDIMRIEYRMKF